MNKQLRCEMDHDCDAPVTHVGSKGYIYCAGHAQIRRQSGYERCRKARGWEMGMLRAGRVLPSYKPQKKPYVEVVITARGDAPRSESQTVVLFRRNEGGTALALMPFYPITPNPNMVAYYSIPGRLQLDDYRLLMRDTKPAKLSEPDVAALAKELESIGYRLDVRTRAPEAYAKRKAALEAMDRRSDARAAAETLALHPTAEQDAATALEDKDSDYCASCSGSGYYVDDQGDHQDCRTCGGDGWPTEKRDAQTAAEDNGESVTLTDVQAVAVRELWGRAVDFINGPLLASGLLPEAARLREEMVKALDAMGAQFDFGHPLREGSAED